LRPFRGVTQHHSATVFIKNEEKFVLALAKDANRRLKEEDVLEARRTVHMFRAGFRVAALAQNESVLTLVCIGMCLAKHSQLILASRIRHKSVIDAILFVRWQVAAHSLHVTVDTFRVEKHVSRAKLFPHPVDVLDQPLEFFEVCGQLNRKPALEPSWLPSGAMNCQGSNLKLLFAKFHLKWRFAVLNPIRGSARLLRIPAAFMAVSAVGLWRTKIVVIEKK